MGYQAVIEPHGWSDILSFKQAAVSSGLGVMGKGGFVIHPTLGTLNIIGCIVTDASIPNSVPMDVDLCHNCTTCIQVCKYGAYSYVNDVYRWNPNNCCFYQTVHTEDTPQQIYGPCQGNCINACPVGHLNKQTKRTSPQFHDTTSEVFTDIIKEIEPHVISSDRRQMLTTIKHICARHALTPVPYPTLTPFFDFVLWVTDDELQRALQCTKIGVKIIDQHQYIDTLYDLRDILNHEWAILTIQPNGSYTVHRPLIWSQIQGVKNIINQF